MEDDCLYNYPKTQLQKSTHICIFYIRWPNKISNIDLWQRTIKALIEEKIMKRRWRWLGNMLHKTHCNITRQALYWNPKEDAGGAGQGTLCRDLEVEI